MKYPIIWLSFTTPLCLLNGLAGSIHRIKDWNCLFSCLLNDMESQQQQVLVWFNVIYIIFRCGLKIQLERIYNLKSCTSCKPVLHNLGFSVYFTSDKEKRFQVRSIKRISRYSRISLSSENVLHSFPQLPYCQQIGQGPKNRTW